MNLYLVRHGESVGNVQRIHQNEVTPLSANGMRQVQELAKRFDTIDIDVCICSPYLRTRQTAAAILDRKDIEVEYDNRIVETKRPTEIEGKSTRDPDVVRIKREIVKNADNPDWRYSDEEKTSELLDRVSSFIRDIENRKEDNILVVTHGETIWTIVTVLLYREKATIDAWQHMKNFLAINNTGITLFRRYGLKNRYTIDGWNLVTYNDHAHLG